jgi:hypothetical protein
LAPACAWRKAEEAPAPRICATGGRGRRRRRGGRAGDEEEEGAARAPLAAPGGRRQLRRGHRSHPPSGPATARKRICRHHLEDLGFDFILGRFELRNRLLYSYVFTSRASVIS